MEERQTRAQSRTWRHSRCSQGVARRYSGGSKDRTVTSPGDWWRSECHEETLDTCNVARAVLSAHGTKMNKAQSTKSRGRDGHGNSNCSTTWYAKGVQKRGANPGHVRLYRRGTWVRFGMRSKKRGKVWLAGPSWTGWADGSPTCCWRPDRVSIAQLVSKWTSFVQVVGRGLAGSQDVHLLEELKCAAGQKALGQLEAKTLQGGG